MYKLICIIALLIFNVDAIVINTESIPKATNSLINWHSLDINHAIVRGTGAIKIAVFSDPDCPFCQRFELETLAKLKNITIYYFLVPFKAHKDATLHAKQILCAENPLTAYLSVILGNSILSNTDNCRNADKLGIMQNIAYNIVHITGTPTTIFANGKQVTGLIPFNDFMQLLNNFNES